MSEQLDLRFGITYTTDSAEAVELWLGSAFNSHIPSVGQIEFWSCRGTLDRANVGETLNRCTYGVHVADVVQVFPATDSGEAAIEGYRARWGA